MGEENSHLTDYEKEQYFKVLHSASDPPPPSWQQITPAHGSPASPTLRSGEYWNEITASPPYSPSFSSTPPWEEEEDWQHVIPPQHSVQQQQSATWRQDSKLPREDDLVEDGRISGAAKGRGGSWTAVSPKNSPPTADDPGPPPGNGHQSRGQKNSDQAWPLASRGPSSPAGWPSFGPSNPVPATHTPVHSPTWSEVGRGSEGGANSGPPEPLLANQLRHLAASALPFTQVRRLPPVYVFQCLASFGLIEVPGNNIGYNL